MRSASFPTNGDCFCEGYETLAAVTPSQAHLGVSLLIGGTRRGEYLTGIKPAVLRHAEPPLLRFSAIGGSVEKGEGFVDAAHREAWEEICCPVRLHSAPITWFVDMSGTAKPMVVRDEIAPLAVVNYFYRTPPRQPWSAANEGVSFQAIYAATLDGRPKPTEELPMLAWLNQGQIARLTERDLRLGELLDEGMPLLSTPKTQVYENGTTRLTAAQEALFCALGTQDTLFWQTVNKSY